MAKIKEIWKDVVGYKAKYEISSLGRIRSLDKWVFNGKNGNKSFRFMSGSLMKPTFDSASLVILPSRFTCRYLLRYWSCIFCKKIWC